jgi:dsDNA-binding SOS-regulon protein|tara:strand:- start:490 stop:888 length:399 start_codon:yes stop_codon:yes gene_type:complete
MAVESRFVVIRHGVEAKTFMDKKSADEYDKMLDMADNLAEVFAQSKIALPDSLSEELSVYLAQNRDQVLVALLAKKASKATENKAAKLVDVSDDMVKLDENKIDDTVVSLNEDTESVNTKKSKVDKSISAAN